MNIFDMYEFTPFNRMRSPYRLEDAPNPEDIGKEIMRDVTWYTRGADSADASEDLFDRLDSVEDEVKKIPETLSSMITPFTDQEQQIHSMVEDMGNAVLYSMSLLGPLLKKASEEGEGLVEGLEDLRASLSEALYPHSTSLFPMLDRDKYPHWFRDAIRDLFRCRGEIYLYVNPNSQGVDDMDLCYEDWLTYDTRKGVGLSITDCNILLCPERFVVDGIYHNPQDLLSHFNNIWEPTKEEIKIYQMAEEKVWNPSFWVGNIRSKTRIL